MTFVTEIRGRKQKSDSEDHEAIKAELQFDLRQHDHVMTVESIHSNKVRQTKYTNKVIILAIRIYYVLGFFITIYENEKF